MTARRAKIRGGTGNIHQIARCHMLSHARLSLPERRRLHYDGNTSGDLITGIQCPDISKEWRCAWRDKKLIFGKKT